LVERAIQAVTEGRPAEASPSTGGQIAAFSAAELVDTKQAVVLALERARRRSPPEGLTADQIRRVADKQGPATFRDADQVSRTIYALRDEGWPIPNSQAAGYRLGRPLAELCPALAKLLDPPSPTDNQLTTN
jgi:hypothetical protein